MEPPTTPTADTVLPAAAAPTTPTLSNLLPELMLQILEHIPSTATLSSFLRACPSAWRVYVKHSQPLLLRLARNRYNKPHLTADDIISFRPPFEMPFMCLITPENSLTYLTDSAGRLNHGRCEKVYLLMGGEWVQLPRWGELVERWDRGVGGREERRGGRLRLKRVRWFGEVMRFLVRWESWMGRETGRGRKREKVMERTTEMQCLEEHEELSGRARGRGRGEGLEWVVSVQRRREFLPAWGGVGGKQRLARQKPPVVKATVVKKEKRKGEPIKSGEQSKRIKREEKAPEVQGNGNGEVRIKPDPEEEESVSMPPPPPKPLPRFKLEEDDW
ncbi:hypothetical protein QBC40DRAFT_328711 [Triangularia verruculosa]|uniref:F-box domain-containing protein n=1 Tax=Triangularia verruculosa TaxID=2587418 RepID=A0AAN6XJA6_9PEZI|nr:hypothetical protein QBC40DRAFT_328711 [Triangularia verruculosa]